MRPAYRLAITLVTSAMTLAAALPADADIGPQWRLCARAVATAEALRDDLPKHLLTAVSRVESGRWEARRRASLAWPWTVTAAGEGRFLPSKAAALAEVKRLRARGIESIDVGCMQVNLHYHGHAFDDVAEALDPATNVAYAAEFLLDLRRERGSWTRAIGDYHSTTPRHSGPYRLKVFRAWRAARRDAYARAARARQDAAAR